jgi:hypothetical protein
MPRTPPLRQIARPALAYVAMVFALAFCLGVLRVLWLAPWLGELGAVLIEVPIVLAIAWIVAGAVLRRWPLVRPGERAAMGALSFALLMGAELAIGRFVFGVPLAGLLTAMITPAGLVGLAGQIGFGLIPVLRQPSG